METIRGYNGYMSVSVGSRELKNRLGKYLRLARSGTRIVVTDRGRPVAELRAFAPGGDGVEERLRELVSSGLVSPPREERRAQRRERIAIRGGSVADTVVSERDERL